MKWSVEYNDDLKIVVLTYFGRVTGSDISEAAAARIDLGKEKGVTKFLIDARKVEADELAGMDIHSIPEKLYTEKQVERTSRIAILAPQTETSKKMVRFFESACVNRGWVVKSFNDQESAVRWLQQSSSPKPYSGRSNRERED